MANFGGDCVLCTRYTDAVLLIMPFFVQLRVTPFSRIFVSCHSRGNYESYSTNAVVIQRVIHFFVGLRVMPFFAERYVLPFSQELNIIFEECCPFEYRPIKKHRKIFVLHVKANTNSKIGNLMKKKKEKLSDLNWKKHCPDSGF